jgi:hypothetical protein
VVRRRFPNISVIASSGAYGSRVVPTGVLADAFFAKGQEHIQTLVHSVADLIQTSAAQARAHQEQSAPVWIPRNGKDSNGIPYIVITCTECLQSFPLSVTKEENPEVLERTSFRKMWLCSLADLAILGLAISLMTSASVA